MIRIATLPLVIACCAGLLSGCAGLQPVQSNGQGGYDSGYGASGYRAPAPPAASADQPRPFDALYTRGAAALLAQDVEGAAAAWRRYVAQAPVQSARARQVAGWLTLLDREAARRYARLAAAGERAAPLIQTDPLHVALFPLQNQGPRGALPTKAAFNRALMAMITIDLMRVPTLTVLEREKIDQLVQELKLSDSGLVDPATAATPGRLLGAGTVIAGSVYTEAGPAGPGSGRYRIRTAVSNVGDGAVRGVQDADGLQSEFHVLQKRIVYGILQSLGVRDIPEAVRRHHTESWAAYARFAAGLQLLADNRFDEARAAFGAALVIDPAFALAASALQGTPEQGATLQSITAAVRAGS